MPVLASPTQLNRRFAASVGVAVALVLALNILLGYNLDLVLRNADIHYPKELARRVAACPHPERVRLLVLGNSHTMAALRPPELADALHVPRDRVFSLALPSLSMLDVVLLYEQHAAHFPGVKQIVMGIGGVSFAYEAPETTRYITRESTLARWRYAEQFLSTDDRLGLLAARFFPVVDFRASLRRMAISDGPLTFMQALLGEEIPAYPEFKRWHATPYPWGAPPPWESWNRQERTQHLSQPWQPFWISYRTEFHYPKDSQVKISRSEKILGEWLAKMEARQIPVVLMQTPIHPVFMKTIRIKRRMTYLAYEQAVQNLAKRFPVTLLPPPAGLPRAAYFDPDHLTPLGARLAAAYIAPSLRRMAD